MVCDMSNLYRSTPKFREVDYMTTKRYSRTLVVNAPVIDLGDGVFLPNGSYPVTDEQIVIHFRGTPVENPGRLALRLTRAQLISFGVHLSSELLEIEADVRSYLGTPGITIR